MFDARVYNLPKEEVTNYFLWRQQDASRNSIQMLGHYHFSQKEMHGKNNSQVQDMLMLQKGVNWNDLATWMKRGSCVIQDPTWSEMSSGMRYKIDDEIPIFTQYRNYIEQHLETPEQQEATNGAYASYAKLVGGIETTPGNAGWCPHGVSLLSSCSKCGF
jgi:tRNA(His) 5'-end guanylyltransferase